MREVVKEERIRETNREMPNLPRTQKAIAAICTHGRAFQKEPDRTSRRGEDWIRLQACVSCYCTTFRRPMEPFQHQQSPGQKTNLASQGLSVKKGCLGCKRNWNCLFFFPSGRRLRR